MSRVTEIRVGFCRTLNLGNFNSAKIEASVALAIDDPDDLPAARERAQTELRALLEDTWRAQHRVTERENPGAGNA